MKLAGPILVGLCAASATFAASTAPDDVIFGAYGEAETPLTGAAGDAVKGQRIFSEKSLGNCVSCHQLTSLPDVPFQGEVGPVLDGVGSYRTPAELRGILVNAKMTFDGTVMPAFYKTSGFIRPGDGYTGKAAQEPIQPILSAQDIEDVVAFLGTLTD
ncbi:monoheme cytochrome C SoxX [Salipiger aestuarii]|uniref:Sulfur-oxidizing protein SoxX n=1 Tax=Salipiger aestuarii TaxID=568098 RepID=A0A327XKS8_9RHOB|nr:sulfur oxidation c-type cytochrome SoxX [Salipiger aestuarii]EIE52336.1 monoheme cytochrome c SoxX [Citreicella sp. 357]KAA8605097.1 monoheme cytochrome C SoxX [Salipiger aestuarii]KAA8606882.1 monoheme cytochrome C SoxX [Salipiger aestuarii]KAB2535262.1 monoheme cytochrome C SoxX [Salipiger aestuarii]RAK08556.1 sulfur-oxidizing protein SoxX [Salipiger aestuarii]